MMFLEHAQMLSCWFQNIPQSNKEFKFQLKSVKNINLIEINVQPN